MQGLEGILGLQKGMVLYSLYWLAPQEKWLLQLIFPLCFKRQVAHFTAQARNLYWNRNFFKRLF